MLYSADGKEVRGVATRDAGISKGGEPKDSFTRGIELRAKQTLFGEGARGSCSEAIMDHFNLRAGSDVQTYGLGIETVTSVCFAVAYLTVLVFVWEIFLDHFVNKG